MTDSMPEMAVRLQAYYADSLATGWGARVKDLTAISSGWESEVYAFDLSPSEAASGELTPGPAQEPPGEPLILRVYPGDDAWEKSAREFQGLRELHRAGYPVPEVSLLERDRSPFGKPFIIMERIEGETLWPLLAAASPARQRELLTQFTRLLVQLHQLDWRLFTPVAPPGIEASDGAINGDAYTYVNRWLDLVHAYLERFPLPGFLPVIQWLETRKDRVPCRSPAPIHWDFHPANILLQPDGAAVVIDWTQFEVSDYRFDLAWTLLLLATHASEEWRDFVLEEYERLSGNPVEELEFFEVAACAKRLLAVAISRSYGPEKLGMRPDALAAMESQLPALRQVYQLLREKTGIDATELAQHFADPSGPLE
jgi:aminoglycoside phosphotransferase (APT) family kinase protein